MAETNKSTGSLAGGNSTVTSLIKHVEILETENAAMNEDLQQVHVLHSAAIELEQSMAQLARENEYLRGQVHALSQASDVTHDADGFVAQALQNAEDFGFQCSQAQLSKAQEKILELEHHILQLQRQVSAGDSH